VTESAAYCKTRFTFADNGGAHHYNRAVLAGFAEFGG
jgi:hypothetical protein